MVTDIHLQPIGIIHTEFSTPGDAPRQPHLAAGTRGRVEVFEPYSEGLEGLEQHDRIWLVFWCHLCSEMKLKVTPPGQSTERGVFATRAPCRPNPIGLSVVRLVRIEANVLHVSDVDMVDDTPLLDIKPCISTGPY